MWTVSNTFERMGTKYYQTVFRKCKVKEKGISLHMFFHSYMKVHDKPTAVKTCICISTWYQIKTIFLLSPDLKSFLESRALVWCYCQEQEMWLDVNYK